MRKQGLGAEYREHLTVAYIMSTLVSVALVTQIGLLRAVEILLASGWMFGTAFFLISLIRRSKRIASFLLNLCVQIVLAAIAVLGCSCLMTWMFIAIFDGRSPLAPEEIRRFEDFMTPLLMLVITGAGLLISAVVNVAFEIDQKMGPGVIWNWITGKYYNPREEERIFIFLDMKDSTTLAERLGNLKFSALVRDFFHDMTEPLVSTKGEVSHYIGDEAVLTWRPHLGLKDARCLMMFHLLEEAIHSRAAYYEAEYSVVPQFKAGAHIGQVVATEVGEIKSEIVFHGDVLNTAARLQGLCNEEGYSFLISASLASRLPETEGLTLHSLGKRALKGKESDVEILAVTFL